MQHRDRLATVIQIDDSPLVIGSAKELVESVARVVTSSAGIVVPSNADFNDVVNAAHVALGRQAGKNLSGVKDAAAIADNAKKLVFRIRGLRNDFGTGHGHGEARSVPDEMVSLVVSAAMLWVRWALVRLRHVLLQEPERLIAQLKGHVTRRSLQEQLDALVLPDQPEDVQRALGVAFGQRSAGGTFVARQVGVDGPAGSYDVRAWPAPYRVGLVEGLSLSSEGYLSLGQGWIPTVMDILSPLPPGQIKDILRTLVEKVTEAGTLPGRSVEADYELARGLEQHIEQLPEEARAEWKRLADVVDPTVEDAHDLP